MEITTISGKPLVITGGAGSGKTALLSNWIKWRSEMPTSGSDVIVYHFTGSERRSTGRSMSYIFIFFVLGFEGYCL